MASFYSSNYQQDHDNYGYYYQSYNHEYYEPRDVQHYDHTGLYSNIYHYQQAPTESLVGYHHYSNFNHPELIASKIANLYGYNGDYYDQVTTQFVVSYSTNGPAVNDLDFEEYNPEPFSGGYDIEETYGKALPPSDDICYPPSKIDPVSPLSVDDPSICKPVPSPYGKEGEEAKPTSGIIANKVIQDEHEFESEEDEDDDELEEEEDEEEEEDDEGESESTNGNIVSQVIQEESALKPDEDEGEENLGGLGDGEARNEGVNGRVIRRQIPPGYGIEAMDLCEGLFGGYFPCLLKRNQGNYDQSGGIEYRDEYFECWQGTADYLFGNPNPYGGAMPEKGSYGDPVYSYQRHYPQQSVRGQVQYEEDSSWSHASRFYYGQ